MSINAKFIICGLLQLPIHTLYMVLLCVTLSRSRLKHNLTKSEDALTFINIYELRIRILANKFPSGQNNL